MTLITRLPVTFGAVVQYRGDCRSYLVTGFYDQDSDFAVLDRPGEGEIIAHKHWLTVTKTPRRWKERKRGAHR